MNYKSIFNLLGILLSWFSISFLVPFSVALIYEEKIENLFLED